MIIITTIKLYIYLINNYILKFNEKLTNSTTPPTNNFRL